MFPRFKDVLAAFAELKRQGIVRDYAVFGAIAQMFWDEAVATFDVDVLVLLDAPPGSLVDVGPLYDWARRNGYREEGSHIFISDIPVQFVPAPNLLHEEAVERAATLDVDGVPVRVVRPEYLIATWLQPPANNSVRKERALRLREAAVVDQTLLDDILAKHALSW